MLPEIHHVVTFRICGHSRHSYSTQQQLAAIQQQMLYGDGTGKPQASTKGITNTGNTGMVKYDDFVKMQQAVAAMVACCDEGELKEYYEYRDPVEWPTSTISDAELLSQWLRRPEQQPSAYG